MEPLPVQPEEESPPSGSMPALPNPRSSASTRSSSRRSGRTTGTPGASELGLDWFQGELLLESDEDPEEAEDEGGNTKGGGGGGYHPV